MDCLSTFSTFKWPYIFTQILKILLFLLWGKKVSLKSMFAQISPVLCLFKRHVFLLCTFVFQLSKKKNSLSKVTIHECVGSNIVYSEKYICVYMVLRKLLSQNCPTENHSSVSNLHRELLPGNCLHKIYIIQSACCKVLNLSQIKQWFPLI